MAVKLEEFRHLIPDDVFRRFGPLVESWPKWTWERSGLSQLAMGAVSLAAAVILLVISFQVVVSDKPEEQLPFQQAMWGFAGGAGILMLYGLGTGLWRMVFGTASVGQWWLLCEGGLILLSSGKVQSASPLDELRVKTATSLTGKPQVIDGDGRAVSLPVNAETNLVEAIQQLQRKTLRDETSPTNIPFCLAWMEAKLFGEDSVYRIYPDVARKSVLLIYAGQFLPQKMGQEGFVPNAVRLATCLTPAGLVVNMAAAYGDWIVGKNYDKRAAHLDGMTLDELRMEARNNDASRILTPSQTTELRIAAPVSRFWSNDFLQSKVTGVLSFTHQGKHWELSFFTREEENFAREGFTEALDL